MPGSERFASLVYPSRLHEVEIREDGVLPLPQAVLDTCGLREGDVLALGVTRHAQWIGDFQRAGIEAEEAVRLASLPLEIYAKLLSIHNCFQGPEAFWPRIAEFLSLPLTAVGPDGGLPISPELFPLRQGERVEIDVQEFELSLSRKTGNERI